MTATELGEMLWRPGPSFAERSELTRFRAWLARERGVTHETYASLWLWSVEDLPAFWRAVWDYFDIIADGDPATVVEGRMPRARWFPGTRLNYAEHVLRHETKGDVRRPAIRHSSELRPLRETNWKELGDRVRTLATTLRGLGVKTGDRIASYMPNIVETAIAMLATTAVGATWASAAPEFGAKTVVDRFGQIGPTILFVADGYRYGGKDFDRSKEIAEIVAQTPSIKKVVWLDYRGGGDRGLIKGVEVLSWESLFESPAPDAATFRFERVASDHPLWVLFSSGTTGLPKAIVHGHHGIVLEAYKNAAFHFNLKKDDVLFFYSTTGWMMWNTLMNAVLMDGVAVLFDGHPSQPDPMSLWSLAENAGATAFGTNPTVTQIMRKLGLTPRDSLKFERLENVMLVGSPATPDAFRWVYDNVKDDVWVTSQSGGTEFCSGLLGGVPTEPVRAGLIDAPSLGVNAKIFNEDGQPVLDEPGELVIASPMPSMPLKLWGDDDYRRYRETYFDRWPDVWRHGDSAQINSDLTCQVFGRSDATLNRYGVRIGSAEIYRTLENMAEVADSLVVCIELPDGGYYMPLFVTPSQGASLDEALSGKIRSRLRSERSPRHVPDEIVAAPEIPMTLSGKKMEVPIRKLLMGARLEAVASEGASRNPAALVWFADFAARKSAELMARIKDGK